MRAVVVIPARFKSTRFPGKPLASILGKPMILWVAELSAKAVSKENVYVATDDERIERVVVDAGFNVVLTSSSALTGTDRVAEAATKIDADIYINVQGDEPLLDPEDIKKVIDQKRKTPSDIINAFCELSPEEDPLNVNIPKVIFSESKRMIYMSRAGIPGYKNLENKPSRYFKQVCIYAFSLHDLKKYADFGRKSELEFSEDIEILRFLEWGATIHMVETQGNTYAVDIPSDVEIVERELGKLDDA